MFSCYFNINVNVFTIFGITINLSIVNIATKTSEKLYQIIQNLTTESQVEYLVIGQIPKKQTITDFGGFSMAKIIDIQIIGNNKKYVDIKVEIA